MMTADLTNGRLAWYTARVDKTEVKAAKGKGKAPKADKIEPVVDVSSLKPMTKSKVEDLDSLVASMENTDVIPSIGEGLRAAPKKKKMNAQEEALERAVAKYSPAKAMKVTTRVTAPRKKATKAY